MVFCSFASVLIIFYMFQSHFKSISSFRLNFNRIFSTTLKNHAISQEKQLKWPVQRVRDQFVNYFVEKHQHINIKSSPCVPLNDPTLLFTNAGMNQFKPIFIGTVDPSSPLSKLSRVANSQKCIRAGGKHNDLDDVGKDTYHHTFFEMLGSWSFNNHYFKKEAISWAYDLLVNHYKLDPNRLYASYFAGDDALGLPCDNEAKELWCSFLPSNRVLPFDKKANFWEMGESGPCGPCSEIHYDRIGNGRDASSLVNKDDPSVIEIWNLVFIQYNREINGILKQLPAKHIDTGMGLERLTSILQDVPSNYDTDIFLPIFDEIQRITSFPFPYSGKIGEEDAVQNYRDTAYRIIADHIRTLCFAIADGAYPSNDGRGYVLRRILRRAIRYGIQTLSAKPGFLTALASIVPVLYGKDYPELIEKIEEIKSLISEEEKSFSTMLEKGIKYFHDVILIDQETQQTKMINGEKAFYLYDTLGFPIDLTQIMASEKGLTVDLKGFQQSMNIQRERGRVALKAKRLQGRDALKFEAEQISYLQSKNIPITDDEGKYASHSSFSTKIQAIYTSSGFTDNLPILSNSETTIGIILEKTSFYSESGGQIADTGEITVQTDDGTHVTLDVIDTQVRHPPCHVFPFS
jgi:alanyl-tRNA synthetase